MSRSSLTFQKRQRERKKQEKKEEKLRRKQERGDSKEERSRLLEEGIDPDIADIVPGPQPDLEDA